MSLPPVCEKYWVVAVATAVLACSGSPGPSEYDGTAFPSRRPRFELGERRLGYAANRNSDTVSVLDLDAMTLLGTVPVGRDPVDIDGPRHVVLDAEGGRAYVALSYPFSEKSPHALAQGETQRSGYVQALTLSDLSILGDLRVDPSATDVAFSPATGRLAVTHHDVYRSLQLEAESRRANLVLVDAASAIAAGDAASRSVPVCAAPAATAFDSDGSRVFVACTGEDSVVVVDSRSAEVLSRVPAGIGVVNKPYALVADAARDRLLVSNEIAATVSVFDMGDTPSLLSTLSVPGTPSFAAFISESTLAVPFRVPNGVALLDLTTGELLLKAEYSDADCLNPAEVTVTNDSRLRLVCEGTQYTPGVVVELDPQTLAITSSVSVGLYPERLAIFEP